MWVNHIPIWKNLSKSFSCPNSPSHGAAKDCLSQKTTSGLKLCFNNHWFICPNLCIFVSVLSQLIPLFGGLPWFHNEISASPVTSQSLQIRAEWNSNFSWHFSYHFLFLPMPSHAYMLVGGDCRHPLLLSTLCCSSVTKSCLTLWTHGLQHARLFCSPPSPGVCSNWCSLSQWCYLTISSSATLVFFCLHSFPASWSFPMSQLFTSHGQSTVASASASSLPMNIWADFN